MNLHAHIVRNELGVKQVAAVVGGSLGGMQALEWALLGKDFVRKYVAMACGADHSPWQIAFGETQRQAIYGDPKWQGKAWCKRESVNVGGVIIIACNESPGGDYDPADPPAAGLSVARQFAMISYRTPTAYAQKFGRERVPGVENGGMV